MPKRDPLRQARTFTDEELDRLAEITDEDIERAADFWRDHAAPAFRDLLDARPTTDPRAPRRPDADPTV